MWLDPFLSTVTVQLDHNCVSLWKILAAPFLQATGASDRCQGHWTQRKLPWSLSLFHSLTSLCSFSPVANVSFFEFKPWHHPRFAVISMLFTCIALAYAHFVTCITSARIPSAPCCTGVALDNSLEKVRCKNDGYPNNVSWNSKRTASPFPAALLSH